MIELIVTFDGVEGHYKIPVKYHPCDAWEYPVPDFTHLNAALNSIRTSFERAQVTLLYRMNEEVEPTTTHDDGTVMYQMYVSKPIMPETLRVPIDLSEDFDATKRRLLKAVKSQISLADNIEKPIEVLFTYGERKVTVQGNKVSVDLGFKPAQKTRVELRGLGFHFDYDARIWTLNRPGFFEKSERLEKLKRIIESAERSKSR